MKYGVLRKIGFSAVFALIASVVDERPCFASALSSASRRRHRYRARVAYDGAGFAGFQAQSGSSEAKEPSTWLNPTKRTVQSELEHALTQRFGNKHAVRVVAAGRTDAGVHARGQAIHFDLDRQVTAPELADVQASLNKMLTKDVRIFNLQRAPPPVRKNVHGREQEFAWNVMYDSTYKLYSYRLHLGAVMDPLERHNHWHPDRPWKIDVEKLKRLLPKFVGTLDYRAFAGGMERLEKLAEAQLDTVRTVYAAELVDEGEGYYRIDFSIKGALYKQIRSMVGTLLDVCEGNVSEVEFCRLLDDREETWRKDNKSKPAPPQGLTLEHVFFEEDGAAF